MSIEKQKIEAMDWFAEPASHATAALDGNRSERNMTHETFSDIETSGFTGALAGGPAGNSRARNSPKASVHAATLSSARRRVNQSSSKCNGGRSRNRARDTRIFDLHQLVRHQYWNINRTIYYRS